MSPMTEQEAKEYVAKGGEFGELVAKLTQRVIDAETMAASLQTTVHLQEQTIDSLQKRLSNSEAEREDLRRDVGLMGDAENKIGAILRETRAQRLATPRVETLPGSPAPADNPRPRLVIETALHDAVRDGLGLTG